MSALSGGMWTAYRRALEWLWPRSACQHKWEPDGGNSFKRRCACCGRREWLFCRKYPAAGEPAYTWEWMGDDHL
jgi:hypothetical protein